MTTTPPPIPSSATRALLDAARPALGPDAEAARRMRARIAAGTAAGGAVAGVANMSLASKLAIGAVAVSMAAGIAVVATRAHDRAERAVPPAALIGPSHAPIAPAPVPVAGGSGAAASVADPAIELPAVIADVNKAPAPPRVEPAGIALAREVELVDRAAAALKRHEPSAAIATIVVYDGEARGRGQLAEDAAAIDVEARCQVHDPDARARLATFARRFPRSAQQLRLATLCP